MSNDNTKNKILLAFILVIIVLILVNYKLKLNHEARLLVEKETANQNPEVMIMDPATTPPVQSEPAHMPIYTVTDNGDGPIPTADYTNVPANLSNFWQPLEPKGIHIVDGKRPDPFLKSTKSAASMAASLQINSDTASEVAQDISKQEAYKKTVGDMIMLGDSSVAAVNRITSSQANIIKDIPLNTNCYDFNHELCMKWKHNNECLINPGFMLKNCPSACGTCSVPPEQLTLITNIYKARPAINCVKHGGYKTETEDKV